MEKSNDYFLNLLNNPTFNALDFTQVGLSIDNTSLQDKNTYLNSDYIKNQAIFLTNGSFDLSKFDNFYDYAKAGFLDLGKLLEIEDLGTTWRAYRNDISAPKYLRDTGPQFKIEKVANPLRQLSGLVTFGLKEMPTLSIREIAETLKVFDPETLTWKESPNETPFDNFIHPKVLATYDENGEHQDPITGEMVKHKKGDRKLNANGTYYYEDLGNRSVYGKEVLSAFDTLTVDGSKWNKLDFLDSDDIEKSVGGSMMRAAALILPAFIPGVGEWYVGARVALGMSQILPAVGKTIESFLGTDLGGPLFNYMEAFDKALSFSLSDYTLGSLTDEGETLMDSHMWSMETGLKLVADVFTLLAELRWMFEKSSSLFSGLDKKIISDKKALEEWMTNYIKNNTKNLNLDEILMEGISKGKEFDPITKLHTQQAVNWSRALQALSDKLQGAQELGGKISMAYMTGITTASSYGEAKQLGATDLEAALFSIGYTLGEWKLLNSELGQWILPELKADRVHIKNVVLKALPKIKNAAENIDLKANLGKLKAFKKIIDIGKKFYENEIGEGVISDTVGATISNMASEGIEETAEELLLDFSKTIFNALSPLGSGAKFDDAFKNTFDRYALSLIGGAVGGSLGSALPNYQAARRSRKIGSQELATKEIIDLIQQGKELELLDVVNKMTWGSKYFDEEGNQVSDPTKSRDFLIKKLFNLFIQDVKDILTANGANLDKDSLLKELGTKDIRYGILSSIAAEKSSSVSWYLNRYNELSSELVADTLALRDLNNEIKTDREKREEKKEEKEEGENSELTARKKELEERIKRNKKEILKFKDGTMSAEFILDAVFEMISKISSLYVPTDLNRWVEEETGKTFSELNANELKEWTKKFEDSKPLRRDLIRLARLVHIQNMKSLSKIITDFNSNYFLNKDAAIANIEKVLGIFRGKINEDNDKVSEINDYFTLYDNEINPMLYNFLQAILDAMDTAYSKNLLKRILDIKDTKTGLAQTLGIDSLPKTLEELRALDDTTKKRLFSTLGLEGNVGEIIESYVKRTKNPDTGEDIETLSEEFEKEIKDWETDKQIERNMEFKGLLIEFLTNPEVKKEIIKRLSSAKYMLPTVKQTFTDFFELLKGIKGYAFLDGQRVIDPETMEDQVSSLEDSVALEYLDAFKDVPSSPVGEYLNSVVTTLKSKGVKISPLVSNMEELISKLAKARNIESFAYTDEVEKIIDEALSVIRLAKAGLDSAATTIQGDLSDAFGFNATINEILSKRGKDPKLATIPADIAEGMKMDIDNYEQALLYYKSIQAHNSGQALREHDKAFVVQQINLYTKVHDFVGHLEPGDWKELDKLKQVVEGSDLKDLNKEEIDDNLDLDSKKKITKARMDLDLAVYSFFLANKEKLFDFKSKEDRENGIKQIQKLISPLNFSYDVTENDPNTTITSLEKSMPDKDFLWYLASMAATNPKAVMSAYSKVISEEYAPVIGQEEAIRSAVSFLANPKVFKLFADAFNKNILESNLKNKAYLIVDAFRSIFIEGLPGAGKSTAVLKTITDIINEIDPKILKKVIVVSNSKQNSDRLAEGLKFADSTEVISLGVEDFKLKIINGYKPYDYDPDGAIKLPKEDVAWDKEKVAYKYSSNFSLNQDGLDGTLLIIDEATSLSLMDALMVDKFMEAKGIYGLYAGDFDQIGLVGKIPYNGKLYSSISLDGTNYISTHKLGLVIRGNNTFKSDNIVNFRLKSKEFLESLRENGRENQIFFSYYADDKGVYGDVVATADKKSTSKGNVYDLDLSTKDIIANMVNTLLEGEKINFIYDDVESEMYKYLTENYADKINLVATRAALSLEGQYYIVDIAIRENLPNEPGGIVTSKNLFKNLYTAMSRAKQATLIYDRGKNDETISKRLKSVRQLNLTKSVIGIDARKKYAAERVLAIKEALGTADEKLTFDWKAESYEEKKNPPVPPAPPVPPTPPASEGTNEEDLGEQKTTERNERKEPNIENDSEESLNMMIHSFNTYEIGGEINSDGQLELSEHSNERIDNAHGIIKILNALDKNHPVTVKDGKVSAEDTKRIITIIHKLRSAGLYEKTPDKIAAKIREIFDIKVSTPLEVNFIYKNRQSDNSGLKNLTGGPILKFFRGVKDKLVNLFNSNPNEELREPRTGFIGLEIFVDGNLLEIPIGTLTSPLTLLNTKGFKQLKDEFDTVSRGVAKGSQLKKFEEHLKELKRSGNNIPHLNSMLKLLEIYLWNYNHLTKDLNFVVRFNKDFVLNSSNARITGVQTPPKTRGANYFLTDDYLYEGERLDIETYRKRMPDRKISNIYENILDDITDNEGNVVLEHGVPFILVSDYYDPNVNDADLFERYIKQVKEGGEPLITRVYVYLPTESIDYFLYNLLEALRLNEIKQAADLDTSIGNKLTTYRLLTFMLLDDSSFEKAFKEYINNLRNLNDDLRSRSLRRFERLKEIVKWLKNHEEGLKEDYKSGSKSKQILNLLELTPEAIKTLHSDLYSKFWGAEGERNIGNTKKQTIRTILLSEFRKLLFTGTYYEDENSSPGLSSGLQPGGSVYIEKNSDGTYSYKDFLEKRIQALKEDAERNNWKGVMFHSSLEKESDISRSYKSETYTIAKINAEGASYISSLPIQVNGKLDSTAVITDVEPILDEILGKIAVRDGAVVSSVNENLDEEEKRKIYEENTGAYLKSKTEKEALESDLRLSYYNKVINMLDDPSEEEEKRIKEYVDKLSNEDLKELNEVDFLLTILDNDYGKLEYLFWTGSKYKIVKSTLEEPLVLYNTEVVNNRNTITEIFYYSNGKIWSLKHKRELNLEELKNLYDQAAQHTLESYETEEKRNLILEKLKKIIDSLSPIPDDAILNDKTIAEFVFGESITCRDMLDELLKTNNAALLNHFNALETKDNEVVYNPEKVLLAYIAFKVKNRNTRSTKTFAKEVLNLDFTSALKYLLGKKIPEETIEKINEFKKIIGQTLNMRENQNQCSIDMSDNNQSSDAPF